MSKQINIGNAVTMGQLLEFEVAFPGEERLSIERYLAGSSRKMITGSQINDINGWARPNDGFGRAYKTK